MLKIHLVFCWWDVFGYVISIDPNVFVDACGYIPHLSYFSGGRLDRASA